MSAAHPTAPAGMPLARLDEGYPVLAALSPSGRRRLLEAARWMRVPGGTCLFDEHQACEGFPFVVDGLIRVVKSAPNGRELPLYRVGSGETCILSTSCLLGREDYRARGVTESDTVLMLLPQAVVEKWLSDASGWRGIAVAWLAGVLTPAGSIIGLPLAAALLKAGVGAGVLVTYLTSMATLSIIRVPLEIGFYGWRLMALRVVVSLVLPFVAGGMARLCAPWIMGSPPGA